MADQVGRADIDLRVSLAALGRDLKSAESSVRRSSATMQQSADRSTRSLSNIGRTLSRDMQAAEQSVARVNTELGSTARLATAALAAAGGAAAATAVARLADQYTNLSARIRLVIDATDDFSRVQEDLFRIAQETRAPIEAITNLYVRLRQSIADLGDAEAQNMARVLAQTLTISGAGAAETASFLRQISQALASGVLRGDEFNSVMENNSRFAALLAEQLGVGTGELRKMAEEGRLTASVIRDAIAGGASSVSDEFERMPLTIAGAFTQLTNALAKYVGETDSGLGASARLAQGISLLAANFSTLADAMTLVAAVSVSALGGRAGQAGLEAGVRAVGAAAAVSRRDLTSFQTAATLAANAAEKAKYALTQARIELADMQNELQQQSRRVTVMTLAGSDPAKLAEQRQILTRAIEAERAASASLTIAQSNEAGATRVLAHANHDLAKQKGAAATASRHLQTGVTTLKNGLGSLVNFMGGPLGIALAAASIAFLVLRSRAEEVARASASVRNGLEIIASATPAWAGAADAIGETVDATRQVSEVTDQAAGAIDNLTDEQREAAGVTRDHADAVRALAAARLIDAQAAVRQAAADARVRSDMLRSRALNILEDVGTGGDSASSRAADARDTATANSMLSESGRLEEQIPILERGLAALESGMLRLDSSADAASGGTVRVGDAVGRTGRHARAAAESLAAYAEETGRVTEAMASASQLIPYTDSRNAIRAVLGTEAAFRDQNAIVDPLLRVQSVLERIAELRGAAGGESPDIFDREAIDAIAQYASQADSLLDIFAQIDAAAASGFMSPELAERARASVDAMGLDYARAREIVRSAGESLSDVRRELHEIDLIAERGIFDKIADPDAEGAAVVDLLERMAFAARDASEALGILGGQELPEGVSRREAEERIRQAARQGRERRDELENRLFRRDEIRDEVSRGLYEAMIEENWQEALRKALYNVFANATERALNNVADALLDLVSGGGSSGGGGGGLLGSIVGAVVGGIFGGGSGKPPKSGGGGSKPTGKAIGGAVYTGRDYKLHSDEIVNFNAPGTVIPSSSIRAAMSPARDNGKQITNIFQPGSIDARGGETSEERLRVAVEQASEIGAQKAVARVLKGVSQSSSI